MQIILFTDGIYPFVLGGMQKHSYYLAKYLARREVFVDLFHCVPYGQQLPVVLEDFTDKELRFIQNHVVHFPKPAPYPGHYLAESYAYSKQLYKLFIHQPKPDLIYAQGFSGWYLLKHREKLTDIPVFVNFHGIEMFQNAPSIKVWAEHLLLQTSTRFNLKRADVAISLGGKLTPILKKFNTMVEEMPIGIEESWLTKGKVPNQVIKFAFIGRYERRKGVEELHKAIHQLPAELEFEFHLIGPIGANQQMTDPKVFYHGAIREQEMVKLLLEQMDVLVVPSWSEGMPTVILEAMACGCAILATDVGAVSAQVNEQNGWLIEPGNIPQLTNSLKTILQMDRNLLREKQLRSLEKVKLFTWENIIDDHIRLFETIIQKHSKSRTSRIHSEP